MSKINIEDSSIAELVERKSFEERLASPEQLVVKLGVDPTSKDLHLGHAVVLWKLKQFQDLGAQTILVIGDYTAGIGDPAGVKSTRPILSPDEIKENMQTYATQAWKILDQEKTKIRYNSEWLGQLSLTEFAEYAKQLGLNTLTEREDFSARLRAGQPVGFHEVLYPIFQAIDSVVLKADIEIGGWDQRLNLLLARELQKKVGQRPQDVLLVKPLIGLDGERKMSKSYGNFIGLTETADQMYGKVMSLPDNLTHQYASLAARLTGDQLDQLPEHPKAAKEVVAQKIVELYYDAEEAIAAAQRFTKTFTDRQGAGELADEVQIKDKDQIPIIEAVKLTAGVSGSEAMRLINQRAVKLDEAVVEDPWQVIDVSAGSHRLQVGRHRFYELTKEA